MFLLELPNGWETVSAKGPGAERDRRGTRGWTEGPFPAQSKSAAELETQPRPLARARKGSLGTRPCRRGGREGDYEREPTGLCGSGPIGAPRPGGPERPLTGWCALWPIRIALQKLENRADRGSTAHRRQVGT